MWENGVDVKQISIVLSWHDTCPMVKDDGGIGGYEEGAGEQEKMSSERVSQKLKLMMVMVDERQGICPKFYTAEFSGQTFYGKILIHAQDP